MGLYRIVKTIHVSGSAILSGTGTGIAFFMCRSWFTGNLQEKRQEVAPIAWTRP